MTVLGINVQEKRVTVLKFARRLDLSFPLLLDPDGNIRNSHGVIGLPTTFIIGRDGRPVALAVGEREWDDDAAHDLLHALLAEPHKKQRAG